MMTVAYVLVALLLTGGLVLAAAVVGGLWLAISSARPELMARRGDRES